MRDKFEKRLFIGIPVSREIYPILVNIQSFIVHHSGQIRWLLPKNIHITLTFLGNVSLDIIPKLTKALEKALDLTHFRASIEKTGVFPLTGHPKILWLGIGNGRKKIIALHNKVDKSVTPFKAGRKKEKFNPHITVGRAARSYWKIDVLPFLEYVYSPIELDVNSVALYESHLSPNGAVYRVLTKFPLN